MFESIFLCFLFLLVDVCHQQGTAKDAPDHQSHGSTEGHCKMQESSAQQPPTFVHRLQEDKTSARSDI